MQRGVMFQYFEWNRKADGTLPAIQVPCWEGGRVAHGVEVEIRMTKPEIRMNDEIRMTNDE